MYVSNESVEETSQRLLRVIAQADLKVYEEPYTFEEFDFDDFPNQFKSEALALVRDGQQWSQLVRASGSVGDLFRIFSFHFADNFDNSGFVGWLATHLKRQTGTGVFVVCGQNSSRGGIFDYWGCPLAVAQPVLHVVENLRKRGRELYSAAMQFEQAFKT